MCKKKKTQAAATVAVRPKSGPRRVQSVIRKHQPTIKGSLKYNAKVAVLFNRAKANADNHMESRAVRLKARKLNQMKSRARLSDRLKQRGKKMDKKKKKKEVRDAVVAGMQRPMMPALPLQQKDSGEAKTFTK